jgi:hypothetical protein
LSDDETHVAGSAPEVLLFIFDQGDWLRRAPHGVGEPFRLWLSAAEDMSPDGVAAHLVLEVRHEEFCG